MAQGEVDIPCLHVTARTAMCDSTHSGEFPTAAYFTFPGRGAHPMSRLLVLAYGNPLRGDDGVAWHIAQELGKTLHDPSTEIAIHHQLTPELAERVSRAEVVIFLDAVAGNLPGFISLESVDAAPSDTVTWTHVLTPASLLALSRALYRKAPARALLLTVGGGSFEFADDLSDPVRRAIPEAVRKIVELVQLQELGKLGESPVPGWKDSSN